MARSPQPLPEPLPLNGAELHIRLILQALADQITAVWTGKSNDTNDEDADKTTGVDALARAIPARDFMVCRVPAHELVDVEKEEAEKAKQESEKVMEGWMAEGGVWLEENGEKRWIGAESAPE